MKLPFALLGSLALGVLLHGQTTSTTQPAIDPKTGLPVKQKTATDKSKTPATTKAPATKAATPAAKSAADKNAKKDTKKDEPAPKIEGMEIARGDKGFLGLQVASGVFKLAFYDAKKKPIEPDVVRAALRWDPRNKIGSERVILNQEGKILTSGKFIQPPYAFKLFITLFKAPAEGGEPIASENYVVDFNQ